MPKHIWFLLLISFLTSSSFASTDCKKIKFSDVGWTDITASTSLASAILKTLGYEPKTLQLSVPVTFVSLKNKDIDVFLGNWMPSMEADIRPYQKDQSVETVGALLKNAKYTLAVPKYVYDSGIHTVSQLAQHKDKFQGKIYGIEPGNDGNRLIQKMMTDPSLGLKDWKLIESSEQAMLMEVLQSVKRQKWVVFLGWEPHPMNRKMDMVYLDGADGYFGPKQGGSTVFINTRKNYSNECPNISQFLKNFKITTEIENDLMGMILDQKVEPKDAATTWLKKNLQKAKPWLAGVSTLDGKEGYSTLEKALR